MSYVSISDGCILSYAVTLHYSSLKQYKKAQYKLNKRIIY